MKATQNQKTLPAMGSRKQRGKYASLEEALATKQQKLLATLKNVDLSSLSS
jgi:hypothetical protein